MDEEAHADVNHFPDTEETERIEQSLINEEDDDVTFIYEESDSERENENIDYGNDSEEDANLNNSENSDDVEIEQNSNGFVDTSNEEDLSDMPELVSIHEGNL
jgi:hypothetical protein